MGMDVYGKEPRSETGKYFRNNVWWWRPLWGYCCWVGSEVTSKVKYGNSNDGDGLDDPDSIALAEILQSEIDKGNTAKFEADYKKEMDAVPDETCEYCAGTGVRNDEHVKGKCNACKGTGKVRPFNTWCPFEEANVKEFVAFLKDCGGFEIH